MAKLHAGSIRRCDRCGGKVILVRFMGPPINLDQYVWRHVQAWRNLTHAAVREG